MQIEYGVKQQPPQQKMSPNGVGFKLVDYGKLLDDPIWLHVPTVFIFCWFLLCCHTKHTRLTMENSIRADAWALSRLKEYQSGKLILWSWVTRGYVTMEQVAEWYFDSDVDAATTALSSTRGEWENYAM